MILDLYFKKPVFWDYLICILLCAFCYYLVDNNSIKLPTKDEAISITTDVTTISLTLSGFILTLLTVIITFKSSEPVKKRQDLDNETAFSLFFSSGYYFETVKHLKNCIKSLIFIAVLGFAIKLFLPEDNKPKAFYFNVIALGIILLTIWRCVLILSKVLELQREDYDNRK